MANGEEIAGSEVDRRGGADRRGIPRRGEELAVRLAEVDRATCHALGLEHGDRGTEGQVVRERNEPFEERRCERLHALDRDALGHLLEQAGEARELVHHLAGALPHRLGEQQLAARRKRHALDDVGQRALVCDRERAQFLDLVAEELDAHGVVGRGREHVEDAAAHRELAAAGDHVDSRIREVDES